MVKKVKNEAATSREGLTPAVALVREMLVRFPDRSRDILLARFGILGNKRKTLEEIGKEYSITRERVRQVIDAVLKNLKPVVAGKSEHPTLTSVKGVIDRADGIIPMETLLETLAQDKEGERGALSILVHSLPGVKVLKENKERRESVVTTDFSLTEWEKIVTLAETIFNEKKDVLSLTELHTLVSARLTKEELSPEKLGNYLAPALSIEKNVFGRYGLSHWSAIRPRGTRERAYLVLKMLEKPLHFREIARLIDEHGLHRAEKKTHPQTVHNELIKDKRFVLVGRGTYALETWGYKRGTVRQVLSEILKEKEEPMTKEELLKAVMKVRQVKKSTVIINLNTFFTKVGKNIYTLGEK